ncbi:MAG TPA: hypothetical protein VK066_04640 [Chloroflexota bacterium]|nr:hypothetical protein [Chloroflexota bacterium]
MQPISCSAAMRGLVAIAVVVALTLLSPAQLSSPTVRAQEADDGHLLRELAERLLQNAFGSPGPSPPAVDLFPGNVPPDLPLVIRVPPGGRLVGSMVRGPGGALPAGTLVLLVAPGEPREITRFYEQAFEEQGWVLEPGSTPPSGFQAIETNASAFCQPAGSGRVSVIVTPQTDGRDDVRIDVREGPGPCGTLPPLPLPPGASLVPRLEGREGMRLQPTGATVSGPNHWASASIALTDESPGSLEAFFAQQLAAAGWQRRAGQADGPLAWSQWRIPTASDWRGLLLVYEGPGEHQRTFSVQVDRPPP